MALPANTRRPWFIDFSAWHGPSVTDYSTNKIWPEYSGPDHGHSLSLFERSLFMSYMAGAGQITAEGGGAFSFLPLLDDQGRYRLSPYGEACKRFRDFTLAHPDIGVPLTPFAVVLDYHHGAYPGFGKRRAFWHFDYNAGDNMTWELINLLWPGGWEVMGRNEAGAMVNGPFGDIFDILLQNAPQKVLDSYPCLILSGDIRFSAAEAARFTRYVQQGGTLILNSAYLRDFPEFSRTADQVTRREIRHGKGRAIVYGPDFRVEEVSTIIQEQRRGHLPVEVSSGIQHLVNIGTNRVFVTLINNDGVTKEPRQQPVIDSSKARTVTARYHGVHSVVSATDLKEDRACKLENGNQVAMSLWPGQITILEFKLK